MIAIVLGSDTPIGLAVIRELGRNGVAVHAIGRTANAIGGASRYAASHRIRPAGDIADWLPVIISETRAKALMAVSESDLIALAHLPAVIDRCAILTPRLGPLSIVLDKSETLARAKALGINVPQSWQPVVGEQFAERAAVLEYPVVLKWADPNTVGALLTKHGLDVIKAEYAQTPDQLIAVLGRYTCAGAWPLVQHYCAGSGVGQMLCLHKGKAILRFQHRRLHEWPPEGGVSTLCETIPLSEFEQQMALSEALLKSIDWEGPAMVEYRYDPASNTFWLMEINGRFWGSLPLASAAGAEFAWTLFRAAVLDNDEPVSPGKYRRVTARYFIPETRRLARILFAPSKISDPFFKISRAREVFDYATGVLNLRVKGYVFSITDMAPFFRDMANILIKIWIKSKRGAA